jgi:hypothetical protein
MKFVEYSKMNKKQKKACNNSRRTTWDFTPVTRVVPSRKIYNRKRLAHDCE